MDGVYFGLLPMHGFPRLPISPPESNPAYGQSPGPDSFIEPHRLPAGEAQAPTPSLKRKREPEGGHPFQFQREPGRAKVKRLRAGVVCWPSFVFLAVADGLGL